MKEFKIVVLGSRGCGMSALTHQFFYRNQVFKQQFINNLLIIYLLLSLYQGTVYVV